MHLGGLRLLYRVRAQSPSQGVRPGLCMHVCVRVCVQGAFPWFVYQTLAGAIATGSHGSSLTYNSMSHQVCALISLPFLG